MSQFRVAPVQTCPLCHSGGPLRVSHIIPRFVIEWFLETSASGYMRFGPEPNLRVQDCFKQQLLCDECEGMLSNWEKETARFLFRPYHLDTSTVVTYGPWLAKFCASVCWRVLFIFLGLGIKNLSENQLMLANEALRSWSDLMFGRAQHPGKFELHLLPVDFIAEAQGSGFPPNMNRYLARTVEMDAVSNDELAYVYVKMCKLILVGFVQMPNFREWQGTRVEMKNGTIRPGLCEVPHGFWQYLSNQARCMAALQAELSARQKGKIVNTMRADPDRVTNSESFEAMSHDFERFGISAFDEPEE